MDDTSRRGFLAATGAGAAAGTVTLGSGSVAAAEAAPDGPPVVAYIADRRSDEISLMFGQREVVVRDRELVRRILAATRGAR